MEKSEADAYEFYTLIRKRYHDKQISLTRARHVLEHGIADGYPLWQVVGITEAALRLFRDVSFRKKPIGLQRAHLVARDQKFKDLIENEVDLNPRELKEHLLQSEKTILAKREENIELQGENLDNADGRWFVIPTELGLFSTLPIGYRFRRNDEGEFLKQLWNQSAAR